jgi:predicted transcriptional regulator
MKVNLTSKRLFTVRLEDHVVRDLKLLSVDLDKPISAVLAEAVADMIQKYGRTSVAYSSLPEPKKGKR